VVYSELLNNFAKPPNNTKKYIVPNNAGTSYLFERISTGDAGVRMPQNGPPYLNTLDSNGDGINDQQEILNWINSGAPGP
ncbi:MAG: hypothetical protein ABI618_19605, partial [Nitrospirota bacterium]